MDNIIQILKNRGFIYQSINLLALEQKISNSKIKAYIGFDCTAPSLHIGSLIQIMILRWLQKCGHQPIILLGGGTTKIGDPSGKDCTRKILDFNLIEQNKRHLKKLFTQILQFDTYNRAIILDNNEWLHKLNYIDFLREFGQYFSINKMINLESIKLRLYREQSISFLEFNYMLLQAFDFYHLYKTKNCILQVGGSDQWGNIVNGVELIKRKLGQEAFGITSPLITTNNGKKMGKTENGTIWLSNEMLSSYKYWQFWRNTKDTDTIKFLNLFTELSLDEIHKLSKLTGKKMNDAKIILADEATKICHGHKAASNAKLITRKMFETNTIATDAPSYQICSEQIKDGFLLIKLLVLSGLSKSNNAAKKLILGNAVKMNNTHIHDITYRISFNDFTNKSFKLSVGKKQHIIIHLSS